MKEFWFFIFLLPCFDSAFRQPSTKLDNAIIDHFKKNKFVNDEYYVFSFCIPELCSVLENDTTLIKNFKKKFAKLSKRERPKEYYILQDYAISDIKKKLKHLNSLKREYPVGYSIVEKVIDSIIIHPLSIKDYSVLLLQKSDES